MKSALIPFSNSRISLRLLPSLLLAIILLGAGCPGSGGPGDVEDLGPAPIRVNAGGGAFVDSEGKNWLADTNFNVGTATTTSVPITGSPDGQPYQSNRWDTRSGSELMYSFLLDPGQYTVRLHFAEVSAGTPRVGDRIFNVLIEGQLVLDNFDIVAAAGFQAACVRAFDISLTDGQLDIQFIHRVNDPLVSGIEVLPTPPTAPDLSVSRSSIAFGNEPVGSASSPQTVVLTNNGDAVLNVSGVSVQGADAFDFSSNAAPSYAIDPGKSAAIDVTFTPTATGARSANLVITSNDANNPAILPLSGTGVAAVASLSTTDINFGSVFLAESDSAPVTITNTGNQTLEITSIGLSGPQAGDFGTNAAASYSIAPSDSESFNVDFNPSATGERDATLSIVSNDPASPGTVALTGTGVVPQPPTADVSPVAIDFGGVVVNETSASESVTVMNTGDSILTVTNVAASGDFATDAATPFDVAPGGSAMFNATFTPTVAGAAAGQIDITSNDPAGAATVLLSGQGQTPPAAALNPTSADFGDEAVSQTSPPIAVTLSNTGEATLEVSAVSLGGANPGDFSTDALSSYSIPGGQFVAFNVTFTPAANGARSASLSFVSNDPSSPAVLPLSGTGTDPAPAKAQVSPGNIAFGSVALTENSPPQAVTITNIGDLVLNVTNISIGGTNPGDFSTNAAASYNIDPSESVMFNVTFTPTAQGARAANLVIASNDANSPATVPLTGDGVDGSVPQFTVAPSSAAFGTANIGSSTSSTTFMITNDDGASHSIDMIEIAGTNPNDFLVTMTPNLPLTLPPGASASADVAFAPTATGARSAELTFRIDNNSHQEVAALSGTGQNPPPPPPAGVAVYRINVGGDSYDDTSGNTWSADQNFNTGNTFVSPNPIAGTNDDPIYQSERWDSTTAPELMYSLPLANGSYDVRLHFAEIFDQNASIGARVFNVLLEGQVALSNYDVFATAGFETAVVESIPVNVTDGQLDIELNHVVENPKLNGIEVITAGGLAADKSIFEWGHVGLGALGGVMSVTLANTSDFDATISGLSFNVNQGVGHDFHATLGGTTYAGAHIDITHAVNVVVPAQDSIVVPLQFLPTEELDNDVNLVFSGDFAPVTVRLLGTGGADTGHPFLHVVIVTDPYVVDFDGDGSEPVELIGQFSHTHELGHFLTQFEWRENGSLFSTAQDVTAPFSVGDHTVTLTIYDDNVPPETLSGSETFSVVPPSAVPGGLALYYPAGGAGGPNAFLDSVPANASFAETLPDGLTIVNKNGFVGGSPFATYVMVQMLATITVDTAGDYAFQANGGNETRLFLDGGSISGPVALAPGTYDLDARFAVDSTAELPISVTYAIDGGAQMAIDPLMLTHDEAAIKPVINSMPTSGLQSGGEAINIGGLGFFPSNQVTVHWGGQDLSGGDLNVTPTQIALTTPSGTGSVQVTVETPNGVSNAVTYTYNTSGPAPVQFNVSDLIGGLSSVTAGTIGPDGRLYVSEIDGTIYAITFDENYQVTNTQTITTLEGVSNPNILGLTTSPFEAPGVVKLYVAHGLLFANGGACFSGFSPYSGQISVLTGPNFNNLQPLITKLPVSNHDHSINGIEFDDNGFLLISAGGNTNAGVAACNIGDIDESPFSAAILRANIFRPGFNGMIDYIDPATCSIDNDQVSGGAVRVAQGVDVDIFAAGFRNCLDMAYTTAGRLYATDNGANLGFGPISTGENSQAALPDDQPDELNFVDVGRYYGSPNRSRGDGDQRQYVYRFPTDASIEGNYDAPIAIFPASTNGLIEYRANTFNGAMRGELVAQKWNGKTYRVALSADGKSATAVTDLFTSFSVLNLVDAPGGAILGIDYTSNKVMKAVPNDIAATGLTVYDIFPWRAPAAGGNEFIISGANFGSLGNTSVTIGGASATLTDVTSKRIVGTLPAGTAGPDLVDVVVTVGATSQTLPNAFKYLRTPATDSGAAARFHVDPGGNILESSTYGFGSFNLVNESTGGQQITRFRVNNAESIIHDSVFDPDGVAGDPVGKDFTFDNGSMTIVSQTWFNPRHGGFDALELEFQNFGPGQTLRFSADMDPSNIQGAPQPGPNDSGSISGLELTGAHVYVEFDDGSVVEGRLFAVDGSETGGDTTTMFEGAPPAPQIEMQGVCAPQLVANANQTITVTGPAGYGVRLLHAEAGLYLSGVPGGGFDVDPYEYNNVIGVTHLSTTIGGSGSVNIPVTLTKSDSNAGYNVFSAVLVDAQGNEGATSRTLVVQLN